MARSWRAFKLAQWLQSDHASLGPKFIRALSVPFWTAALRAKPVRERGLKYKESADPARRRWPILATWGQDLRCQIKGRCL